MKKVFLIATSFLFSIHSFSQVSSSCQPPAALMSAYADDVKDLAFTQIKYLHSADTSQINIPTIYQDTIWHGLAAIFNAFSIPARDSVFDIYCVHNTSPFNTFLFHSLYVSLDTTYTWTHPWLNLNITSGNVALDNMLAPYGFAVTHLMQFGNYNIVTLTTAQTINVIPLIDSLESFSGVIYAEPSPLAGDADRIDYSKTGNDQFFDFTLGWGDCPSGCINRYTWKFKVAYDNCSVQYLGAVPLIQVPEPFPSVVGCDITHSSGISSNKPDNVLLLNNPVGNEIAFKNLPGGKWTASVYNSVGQLLSESEISEDKIRADNLSAGLYYVFIRNGSDQKRFTVIKK